jgi:hypothetical protein
MLTYNLLTYILFMSYLPTIIYLLSTKFTYLFTYLPIMHLFTTYLPKHLPIYLPSYLFIYLPTYLFIDLCICIYVPTIYLPIYLVRYLLI